MLRAALKRSAAAASATLREPAFGLRGISAAAGRFFSAASATPEEEPVPHVGKWRGQEGVVSGRYGANLDLEKHYKPAGLSDRFARTLVSVLRFPMDLFFKTKYIHRAVVLETVAAVPGMVGGMLMHLRSLRRMENDGGWIYTLLEEAENERMHLLTFIKLTQPSFMERMLVLAAQGVFFNAYFVLYLFAPKTAHRMVGYLEEEAVISYTHFLEEIDAGRIENCEVPRIAHKYWHLPEGAKLRELVEAVRLDECKHRDVNHDFADTLVAAKK